MALFLALLFACGPTDPALHSHGPDGDHVHDKEHAAAHEAEPHGHGEAGAHAHAEGDEHKHHGEEGAMKAPLGEGTVEIEASAEALRVVARDSAGELLPASGEAKVVLTGTGEEEQRLVLAAGEEGWSGPAKAEGAPGYVAVVSVEVGGETQVARVSWGDVPGAKPAPEPHAHDEAGGHAHGEGGNDHGEGGHGHDH